MWFKIHSMVLPAINDEWRGLMLTVETPIGAIRISESDYYDHPGVWIEFKSNYDAEYSPLVLVEYSDEETDTNDGDGVIVSRLWKDPDEDDYISCIHHLHSIHSVEHGRKGDSAELTLKERNIE